MTAKKEVTSTTESRITIIKRDRWEFHFDPEKPIKDVQIEYYDHLTGGRDIVRAKQTILNPLACNGDVDTIARIKAAGLDPRIKFASANEVFLSSLSKGIRKGEVEVCNQTEINYVMLIKEEFLGFYALSEDSNSSSHVFSIQCKSPEKNYWRITISYDHDSPAEN